MTPILLALLLAAPVQHRDDLPAQRGRVVKVKDGDSLVVSVEARTRTGAAVVRQVEVRVHGVDAPEHGQPHGDEARAALAARVQGREVELLETGTDRYGRRVAVVLVDGRDAGRELLEAGFAWAYRFHLGRLEGDAEYCAAEYRARGAGAGLWAGARPTPPWARRGAARGPVGRERSPEDCVASFGRR